MPLKKSIYYKDVCMTIANNSDPNCNRNTILIMGTDKWHITTTLVYARPKDTHMIFWLDDKGDYVYYALSDIKGNYPIIGKLKHINEPIEAEY